MNESESKVGEPAKSSTAPAPDADAPKVGVTGGDFDDPDFIPSDDVPASSIPSDVQAESDTAKLEAGSTLPIEIAGPTLVVGGVTLGPVGVDAEGRVGRVHTVRTGDTLWDVSNAYLGTAWVWPSVWNDNDDILNPHLIMPGERLWISSTEIRRISDAEADEYLAGVASGRFDRESALGDTLLQVAAGGQLEDQVDRVFMGP